MNYDSLMIVDEHDRKRVLTLNIKRSIRDSKKNKYYKPYKDNFIIGEVGSGMSYKSMRHILDTGATFHAGHRGRENLIQSILGTKSKETKRQIINRKRAHTYRKKHVYKNTYGKIYISRESLKKIKKYLSCYGKYSIKVVNLALSPSNVSIDSYDKDVFKHLYLYNSKTGDSISFENYILISSMSNTGIDYWYDPRYRLTGDDFNGHKIALKKGEFNQIKLMKDLSF